jgi:hypothetical protein
VPHQKVFAVNKPTQDLLRKFNLPWSQRVDVLKLLDDHNVNDDEEVGEDRHVSAAWHDSV